MCRFCSRPLSRKRATWPQLAAREAGTLSQVGGSVPSSSLKGPVIKKRGQKDTGGQLAAGSAVRPLGPPGLHRTLPSGLGMRPAALRGHSPGILSTHRVQPRLGSAAGTCPLLKARRDPSRTGTLRTTDGEDRRPVDPLGSGGERRHCWKNVPLQEARTDSAELRVQDKEQAWPGRRRPQCCPGQPVWRQCVWPCGETPCQCPPGPTQFPGSTPSARSSLGPCWEWARPSTPLQAATQPSAHVSGYVHILGCLRISL